MCSHTVPPRLASFGVLDKTLVECVAICPVCKERTSLEIPERAYFPIPPPPIPRFRFGVKA